MPDIDESGIEPWHRLDDLAEEDITHREIVVRLLVMQLDELFLLQKGYLHFRWGCVDD